MQHRLAPKLWAPKLIAILLLLSTIFTLFPTVAFAEWVPPVANGSEGVGTGGGVTTGTFNDTLSGYRVSIISRTGEMVKPPQDFLFSSPPSEIAFKFTENKWKHKTNGESKYAPSDMPIPIKFDGNTFQPNGLELKNWLMQGEGKQLGTFVGENFYNNDMAALEKVQKDIKIIFEPIFFFRVQSLEYVMEAGKDPVRYVTNWNNQVVYGTITELAAFAENNSSKLGYNWTMVKGVPVKGNPVYGGNTSVVVVNAGPNALITSERDEELDINKAKPAEKIPPKDTREPKNGIGLHIYSSEGGPKITSTHTWDFPVQDPAPAPDPKDIPKLPEEKVDKTRVYNIVKTYRDRDSKDIITHVATTWEQNHNIENNTHLKE